jgi:type 2 lantibiotic biosynthesis protein LanM
MQSLIRPPSAVSIDAAAIESALLAGLQEQLLMMTSRVMVLELNVARLQGLLPGATPQERFANFLERARQPHTVDALFQEYPVLGRQLAVRLDQWAESSLEFLQRLFADWSAIRRTLLPADPGVFNGVQIGAGDRHRSGRSVLIARFSGGAQLVYKPRSMAVDVHFQELLLWLNASDGGPMFQTLNILDRGSYGWTEFISARSCACSKEVSRFYERQGGYLALLYALEATDFHCENLIAAGEHPMLLDLEALFHPRLDTPHIQSADQLACSAICYSVLRVGLLPQRFPTDAREELDLSGLGGAPGQVSPRGVPAWVEAGTDEMRLARKRIALPGVNNRPLLGGAEVDPVDYAEAIASGFEAVYRKLRSRHDELLAFCARFANDEVRVIARGTQTYAALLFESFHPDVLRDPADRDLLFDRLSEAVEHQPALARLIEPERADLLKGDIPVFTTHPSSRDLWTGSGERLADYLVEPAIVAVQHRIQRLSDRDLEQQLWIVRASLATLSPVTETPKQPILQMARSTLRMDRRAYLAAACSVGDRLEALALRGDEDVSWIGLTHLNGREWCLAPLAAEFYDGLPGIILFLAYLGAVTHKESYTALAKGALTTLLGQLTPSCTQGNIGAFNGAGGIIYTLAHLGMLWDDPLLFTRAEGFVRRAAELIQRDAQLDIIGGSAGCILALAGLYHCAPSAVTIEAARACGERLLEMKQQTAHGIGWLPNGLASRPLTGFAHGNAGIACALLELSRLTGELRFRSAALHAIAYERSLFLPERGNWPDLRSDETRVSVAWCHGAPGIGLARLRSLRGVDESAILAEIEVALDTTLAHGFGFNHSLCHGDLGNVDFLLEAGLRLHDRRLMSRTRQIAAGVVDQIRRFGWICANPLRIESPGLMTGLAGIGYEMLRLAELVCVPSILSLAPPVKP